MNKLLWGLTFVTVMGCQSGQVREERLRLVEQSPDIVLCYSLIDESFELPQKVVLAELKRRKIESCLPVIAENECPEDMESRQECIDKTKVRLIREMKSTQSGVGTELLIKGFQIGAGAMPF